ncbi:MAG: hypothetical protein J2P17_26955, partial [Mycobacterium sp.]|nr:hypothetical protein [Mycobacterium sp.]
PGKIPKVAPQNAGGGSSTRSQNASDYDLIDVNGDGLPDLVTKCLDNSDGSINVSFNCPTIDPNVDQLRKVSSGPNP